MENIISTTGKKTNIRKIVVMGMLAAISIVLVYAIRLPIIPIAPFLEYDPADIPILIGTFLYGPVAGFMLTIIASVIQGVTVSAGSNIIGIIMHIVATGSCVLVVGNIYHRNKTKKTAIIALVLGALVMTTAMVLLNLVLTPLFLGQSLEVVIDLLLPAVIPFNLIKAGLNCSITFMLYKSISYLCKGE